MPHAEKCPVCDGVGMVNRTRPAGNITEFNIRCYGCKGLGWVEVSGKDPLLMSGGQPGNNETNCTEVRVEAQG